MTEYGRHRVRWSKADEAFEMQCDACLDFLPITTEFWVQKHGLTRCRACFRDANNARQRDRNRERRDDSYRLAENLAQRMKRRANRDALLEYRRAYYRAHRERICSQRRELYARRENVDGSLALRA